MGARASFHPHRRFPGSARRTLRRVYHAPRHLHDRTFFRPRTAYVRQLRQPRQRHPGSKERKPFYTGLTWYRVVPGFVIQSGNPGLRDTDDLPAPVTPHFPDEFTPGLGHDASGILSMVNAGPGTSSCEFFLTLAPTPRLNYLHAVLGRTVRGLEILPQIRQDDDASIKIIRVGPAAEAFHVTPPRVYRRGGHRESIHGVEHPRRAVYSALRSTRMRGFTIIRRELLPSLDQQPPGGLAGPAGRPIEYIRAFHVGQELDRVLRAHDAQTMLKARSPLPGCPAGIGARRTLYPGLSQQRVTDYRKKAKLP